MSNTKKIASIAFTGAATTAATMMAAAPAFAASAYNIKAGTPAALYHGVVKGKLKTGTTAVLVDNTKNNTLTCRKATVSGSISNGKSTGTLPATVGKVKKTTTKWSSCTGPFGLTFHASLVTSANVSISALTGATGAKGHLKAIGTAKISGKIHGSGLAGGCTATISGTSVPAKYVNASHAFVVNSGHAKTLHVKSATGGCLGALATSDTAYFAGTYVVSNPAGLIIS